MDECMGLPKEKQGEVMLFVACIYVYSTLIACDQEYCYSRGWEDTPTIK